MDRMSDLEKILSAARDLGKNLQDDVDKLREDNKKLEEENKNLRADNEKLKNESDSLLEENLMLETFAKDLRAANETFGVNLNKLMGQLNQAINDSHEKFMSQINTLMRDEFQKFLTEYMSKVKADTANKKYQQSGKKKAVESTALTETEIFVPAKNSDKSASKEVYADFYAEETVGK